jgi:inorganic pyrophosphatase
MLPCLQVSKELPYNPILQDSKKGKARFVHNCFPHKGYIWNYGCIPQTWEHPEVQDSHTSMYTARTAPSPVDFYWH